MKLSEKGRHAPPPRLPRHAQGVVEVLAGWSGVVSRAHWRLGDETVVDGADFYVGERELGHLHLDGEAHIAVGRELGAALVKGGLAERFPWATTFVQHAVKSAADAERALFLFELAHARLNGASRASLEARVAESIRARKPAHLVESIPR